MIKLSESDKLYYWLLKVGRGLCIVGATIAALICTLLFILLIAYRHMKEFPSILIYFAVMSGCMIAMLLLIRFLTVAIKKDF